MRKHNNPEVEELRRELAQELALYRTLCGASLSCQELADLYDSTRESVADYRRILLDLTRAA